MSRFEQEWALVPMAARVLAVVAPLPLVLLMALAFLAGPIAGGEAPHPILWGFFLLTSLIPGVMIAIYVLLLGYVWADAGRRKMNQLGWVLLGLFVPGAIGLILYFILRDPLPVPCPSCGTAAGKDQAFCAACGAKVRRSCPECRQPVESGWSHCGHCGAELVGGTRGA
jgi:hypothetical protein